LECTGEHWAGVLLGGCPFDESVVSSPAGSREVLDLPIEHAAARAFSDDCSLEGLGLISVQGELECPPATMVANRLLALRQCPTR
jgi:hypothetical protein